MKNYNPCSWTYVTGCASLLGSHRRKRLINFGHAANCLENFFTSSKSALIPKMLPMDAPRKPQPDIILAKEAMGLESSIMLEEGLKSPIAYLDALVKFQ